MTEANKLLWGHAIENEDWELAERLQQIEAAILRNISIVNAFNAQHIEITSVGIASLLLIDPGTRQPTRLVNVCDDVNRSMLTELYRRLEADVDNPIIMTRERFKPHDILYSSTSYQLVNGNTIREQQITGDAQPSFSVELGHWFSS